MILYFKKIRQKLVAEGKLNRYLFYALGEIILVVIGILIALGINNKNQDKITRQKEQVYLVGLKNEFEMSQMKLKELIEVNQQNYEGTKKILAFMTAPDSLPSEEQLSRLLFNSFAYDITFNPNNSLLNEMINSGSLKDVSDPELRRHLTNWDSRLTDIAQQENDLRLQREKVLDLFRTNEYSIRTIFDQADVTSGQIGLSPKTKNSSNLKLLNSTAFENNLLIFILSSQLTETEHYTPLMEELDLILKLIAEEIEQ